MVQKVLWCEGVVDMLAAIETFESLVSSTISLSFCILVCPHLDIHLLGPEEGDGCRAYLFWPQTSIYSLPREFEPEKYRFLYEVQRLA